ncbi:MAG: UDP-N-acetylglucosamine 1-carboxyvinyltransferase [Candidatus Magasanikbacteria bacterium]|nr:UDP-N-acetylglucosamine 1-carboxyvinyltransferase [Candidatus Magasanikbacteria bacterium]
MAYLEIQGGRKLHGQIATQPTKNSALAILCAATAIQGVTTLKNVPNIEEVKRIIDLIKSLGVEVKWQGQGRLLVNASKKINPAKLDKHASINTRASLLLWGALAGRVKKFRLYKSGGCRLGTRTVRPHIYALKKLGVNITSTETFYEAVNNKLRGAKIVMYESGDTTTENVIMAAALAQGVTTLKMVSANYMVQDLCHFLVAAGAKISGIGTATLIIEGVSKLKSVSGYPIMPDPIVSMTLLAAAIVTNSRLTITNCPLEFLELELEKLTVMGQKFKLKNKRLSKNGWFEVVDIEIIPSALKALPDKIYGRPFPGLNIDNLPLFIPILARASGRTLVHDWAYDNRAVYALELQKLGAKITLLDPHRLWVEGPAEFVANEVICPPALRPAVNVLLCMLAAKGRSILRNPYEIDRGYENLYALLNSAGARLKIKND